MHRLLCLAFSFASAFSSSRAADYATHPPMRPLPQPSDRPLPKNGTLRFVDAAKGDDAAAGSESAPWKTLARAAQAAEPGMTIVLRGGIYRERVIFTARGTAEKPIVLRSYPGELAIVDGGLPEFATAPESAWEPFPGGAPGEFRSVKTYLKEVTGQSEPVAAGGEPRVHLLGGFAESMVPLHGYLYLTDLRSQNEYFAAFDSAKTAESKEIGIYCGPGLWFDLATGHIHARLAHTSQDCLKDGENYAGETDPRKVPLIVSAGEQPPLRFQDAAHFVVQDIVARGGRITAIDLIDCANMILEGVTAYGGGSAMRVDATVGLRCRDCAFRGIAAPWTWRGSLKYRSIEARIVSASAWNSGARPNRDFEFGWCEFTDCVDGVFVGGVDGVDIHHSLLEHVSDDGIFVTASTAYDGSTHGGPAYIHENLLSRCLTTFAFGVGHGRQKMIAEGGIAQLGDGMWIYRNVFDFRRPVFYQQPAEGQKDIITFGRPCGDHGSPGWEPMYVYQNTILAAEPPFRNYYASGWGSSMGRGTSRALFNNIFYQYTGLPGEVFAEGEVDLRADGNLHWSAEIGAAGAATFLKRHLSSPAFLKTKRAAADHYADPGFAAAPREGALDLRARNAEVAAMGVAVPAEWPDPLRSAAGEKPGVGAITAAGPWRVGVRGRIDVTGKAQAEPFAAIAAALSAFKHEPVAPPSKRAAIVMGYPAFDAPLALYALEKAGYRVELFDKTWLPAGDYSKYDAVIVTGDLPRAKMEPNRFSAAELPVLRAWLESGGTLVAMRGNAKQLFSANEGIAAWREIAGEIGGLPKVLKHRVQKPGHPWIAHLGFAAGADTPWMTDKTVMPAFVGAKGENILGDPSGGSMLCRIPAGKGAVVSMGWSPAAALPEGRKAATPEMEANYEAQYRVLEEILMSIEP